MRRFTHRSALAAVLAFISLSGCSGDVLTGSPDAGALLATAGSSARVGKPFAGNCDLVGAITAFTTTGFVQDVTGVCHFTHLGKTTVSFTETVVFATLAYHSEAVYIAANGDELHMSISGIATPTATGVTLAGTATTTGGTGRFSNASGEASHAGVGTSTGPLTGTATYHFDGRLSY
jgi:hypothetical protein